MSQIRNGPNQKYMSVTAAPLLCSNTHIHMYVGFVSSDSLSEPALTVWLLWKPTCLPNMCMCVCHFAYSMNYLLKTRRAEFVQRRPAGYR